ncbi:MAG: UvrB/UvrC motif-containing protein, partial [Atribacterota bacterium]|nr:UvrB/UvrC motif-containing protein [Atribacterota bacterium]
RAVFETRRRRAIQKEYNEKHGITPRSITKEVRVLIPEEGGLSRETEEVLDLLNGVSSTKDVDTIIKKLTEEMQRAARRLEFEKAALLRDQIFKLKASLFKEKSST